MTAANSNWIVGALAGSPPTLKDDVRAIDTKLGGMDRRLSDDIAGLRRDMPGIVGDAVRDALKP